MPDRNSGVAAAEILVVVGILVILAALVLVLAPGTEPAPHVEELWTDETPGNTGEPPPVPRPMTKLDFERARVECMTHVRGIVSLLNFTGTLGYPQHSGTSLLLYLVKKGDIDGEKNLAVLFCPGDVNESLGLAGGEEAYRSLDFALRGDYGHLTSYAGRDILKKGPSVKGRRTVVLICDDSEDHHDGKGMVVGLSNGAVKWRDKVENYELSPDQKIEVGEGTKVPELECLLAE